MTCQPQPLSSGGIILSYQCSNSCKHCLYASSPAWKEWITKDDLLVILDQIQNHGQYLTGIHFAGGEPFLNPELLKFAITEAVKRNIPIDYVETNGFWCWEDDKTKAVLSEMKEAGLRAILVSVSPFHLEYVPMDRSKRAIRIGQKVFGKQGVFIYTQYFYHQFQGLEKTQTVELDAYLDAVGREDASLAFATEYGLIPNGRAAVELESLYEHKPIQSFFGETCQRELTSPHHIHIDCYGNYISGLCAGIVLGDGRDLKSLYSGIDLTDKPVLRCLFNEGVEGLFRLANAQFGYQERPEGYIAKCQVCLDIRRHLVRRNQKFLELEPASFYDNLEG